MKTQFTYIGTSSLRNAQPHAVPEAAVCDNGSKKNHKREPLVFGQFTINSIMKPESQMREPKTNLHHNFRFFYIISLRFLWIFFRLRVTSLAHNGFTKPMCLIGFSVLFSPFLKSDILMEPLMLELMCLCYLFIGWNVSTFRRRKYFTYDWLICMYCLFYLSSFYIISYINL